MEKIELTPERIETIVTTDGKILPGGEGIETPDFIKFTKQDHPFLQKFIDADLKVYRMNGKSTIKGYYSSMVIQIYKDYVALECISTDEKNRQRGNASKLMQRLIDIADETGTLLDADVRVIPPQVNTGIPIHPVIDLGSKGKNKIPAQQLQKWFERFGFKYVFALEARGECNMERKPVKNNFIRKDQFIYTILKDLPSPGKIGKLIVELRYKEDPTNCITISWQCKSLGDEWNDCNIEWKWGNYNLLPLLEKMEKLPMNRSTTFRKFTYFLQDNNVELGLHIKLLNTKQEESYNGFVSKSEILKSEFIRGFILKKHFIQPEQQRQFLEELEKAEYID